MGLDMWFREDVARILASTEEAMNRSLGAVSPLDSEGAGAYRQGFSDALQAVAVAFGVYPLGRFDGSGRRPAAGSRQPASLPSPQTEILRWW